MFEVGKWYKTTIDKTTTIINYQFTDKEDGAFRGYGLGYANLWADNVRISEDAILATPKEVEAALTKEAVKRGFLKTKKVKNNFTIEEGFIYDITNDKFYFDITLNRLSLAGIYIFQNGSWAEIIKEKTLDELASEFKTYKHMRNSAQAFSEFLTENKQEVINILNNL
jgi:hypothetical protein